VIVRESIDFQRGLGSKEALGLGWDGRVYRMLEKFANDIQFDPKNKEWYSGYLNVSIDGFLDDPEEIETFKHFVENEDKYARMAFRLGLSYDDADISVDETIFTMNPYHKWWHLRESVNEELVHQFTGRWSDSDIEIYKNPPSIKNMDYGARAISDREGNIWVADNSNTTHYEMFDALWSKKLIPAPWYHNETDDYNLYMMGWQRLHKTNKFYVAETFDPEEIWSLESQIAEFAVAAQERNPQYEFLVESILEHKFT
jgi:hypothetical protein